MSQKSLQITKPKIPIKLVEDPAKNLSELEKLLLVDKLTQVARDGFGTDMTTDDVECHVLNGDSLYLAMYDEKIIGFASYLHLTLENNDILYLSGIVVNKSLQKNGLFYRMNNLAINFKNYDYLSMRTQNPAIYSGTRKIVERLYPDGSNIPKEIKRIGIFIGREYLKMRDFSEDTFVERSTYGRCLYEPMPKDTSADNLFNNVLKFNYESGDSVVLVGRLK